MSEAQLAIMILIVLLSFVGGYFQLKIIAALKKCNRGSVWSGSWLFHADWLEASGKKARKNFLTVLLIELVLAATFFATTQV